MHNPSARRHCRSWCLAPFLLVVLGGARVQAHGVSASYTTITIGQRSMTIEMAFSVADMIAHFGFDANGDQRVTPQELDAALPALSVYLNQHLGITRDGAAIRLEAPTASLVRPVSGQEVLTLRVTLPTDHPPHEVALAMDVGLFEALGQAHTNLVKVAVGDQIQQAVLSIGHPSQSFIIGHERPLRDQLGEFARMGIKHIFLGYDHVLFLLALIIVGGPLMRVVKIVTAFTIAHTITLILAALQIVTLPSRFIESAIALSIVYVAGENLFARRIDHRWAVTFLFGLVHGFGFANALRELGLPTRGLVTSLLAFNAGVEMGQLGIVALLLPVTSWIGRQPSHGRRIIRTVSGLIALCGLVWFIQRAF